MSKQLMICAAVLWIGLFLETPVHGYLDPGSGSMFLQLLLGGVAGLTVIGRLYWQRIVSFFSRKEKH